MASHTDRVSPEMSTMRYGTSASVMGYLSENIDTLTGLQLLYNNEDQVSHH